MCTTIHLEIRRRAGEDIEVTQRLFECGKLIGIQLLDHLVIGDQKFVSLKEKKGICNTFFNVLRYNRVYEFFPKGILV